MSIAVRTLPRIIISLASCVIATYVSLCNDRSFVVRRSRCLVASVVLSSLTLRPLLSTITQRPCDRASAALVFSRSPWSSVAHARLRPLTVTASTTTSASAVVRRRPYGPARPASDGWASPRSNNAAQRASPLSSLRILHCPSSDREHVRHRLLSKRRLPSSAALPGHRRRLRPQTSVRSSLCFNSKQRHWQR